MAIGDVTAVTAADQVYYVDTGMYDTEEYGAVYLIDAEQPAIVDSGIGTNYGRILDGLEAVGIDPTALSYILLTHVHLDHAGGAGHLLERCSNATVLCHDVGVRHLTDPERLIEGTKDAVEGQWQYYADPKPVPENRISGLSDGDTVDLGDRAIEVHRTPGHAPHQVLFYDTGDSLLFTGDAAGIYVPSRDQVVQTTPPSNFDLEQCLEDVRTIEQLDPERLCFAHFGDRAFETDLAEQYKRTLIEWVEAIRQKRAELASEEAVLRHFVQNARLRETWGDEKAEAEARLNARGVLGYLRHRENGPED